MKNQDKDITQKSPKDLKHEPSQSGKVQQSDTGFNGSATNAKGNVNTDTKTFNKPRR